MSLPSSRFVVEDGVAIRAGRVLDGWGIALLLVRFIRAMMARVGHDAKGKFQTPCSNSRF
jgi:hypothetical protein